MDTELKLLSQDRLLEVVSANNETSPEALALYLENAAASHEFVPNENVELAAAFVQQLDGTQTARRLLSVQVLALVNNGESDAATDIFFGNEKEKFDDPIGLQETLLKKLRVLGTPAVLAKFVWVLNERGLLNSISKDEKLETAKLLVENGQPQLALVLLKDVKSAPEFDDVFAETDALTGNRKKAAELVLKNTDEPIDPRLSQVLLSENPDLAWELRDRLSGPASDRTAWISKSWENVPTDDAAFDASELLTQSQVLVERSEKPIQDAQTAFAQSKNTRRVLAELLN